MDSVTQIRKVGQRARYIPPVDHSHKGGGGGRTRTYEGVSGHKSDIQRCPLCQNRHQPPIIQGDGLSHINDAC